MELFMIFIKKCISLIIMSFICIGSQLAMERRSLETIEGVSRDELVSGKKYYIRWNCRNKECRCEDKTLFLHYHEGKDEDLILAEQSVRPQGEFILKKNEQSYKFIFAKESKEPKYMYMYVPTPSCRQEPTKYGTVNFTDCVFSGNDFYIIQPDLEFIQSDLKCDLKNEYLIQGKFSGDYVYVKKSDRIDGKRELEYFARQNLGHGLFSFVPTIEELLKDK